MGASGGGNHHRTPEQAIDLIHQKPGPPVAHAQLAPGGGYRARALQRLQQISLAGPKVNAIAENDTQPDPGLRDKAFLLDVNVLAQRHNFRGWIIHRESTAAAVRLN